MVMLRHAANASATSSAAKMRHRPVFRLLARR
jgi:hypothetical protein